MKTFEIWQIVLSCLTILVLIVTVYYISHSPINAIKIGRRLNNEKQKDNAKRNLFLTLFALRGSPVHYDFVRGLNEIDIVFENTPTVLTAWHKLYDSLQIKNQNNEDQIWELLRVELLSAMAVHLGYHQIRQTDMVREYYPEGHGHQRKLDMQFQAVQWAYFEHQGKLAAKILERMDIQDEEATKNQDAKTEVKQ